MEALYNRAKRRWQDGVKIVLGLWGLVSPWTLGFMDIQYAAVNAVGIGIAIAGIAAWAFFSYQEWQEWLNVALGLWWLATPWTFGFGVVTLSPGAESAVAATWNFLIAGLVVTILAVGSIRRRDQDGDTLTLD